MQAILLTIAYDGTAYAGWQTQANALAVQECMMKAGASFLPAGFTITTASRTDAGVHAVGQRALLKTESIHSPQKVLNAFNSYLPADIRVWRAESVPADFHPRYHAKSKLYVYKIWNGNVELPNYCRDHVLIRPHCDYDKMCYIAGKFIGRHDFNAFSSKKKTVTDTVRQIYRCQVLEKPDPYIGRECGQAYEIYMEGDGFLYNMVRIIAGCIVFWGSSSISRPEIDDRIRRAYQTGDRALASKTLAAKGLTLLEIKY